MKIDSDAIRELADLLNETGLTEIEAADGDQIIRVSKAIVPNNIATAAVPATVMAPDSTVSSQAATAQDAQQQLDSHPGAVRSPMVGTAYMQSEPGAPPYVKKGDKVSIGDTILIIEAMKVMNPIKAEKSGTVTQIMVDNGEPVEYGDVLMIIE